MENEDNERDVQRRPGYLTAYANHAKITKQAAAKQLARVGIDYIQEFDFTEADRLRAAARHADRAKFAKPIYRSTGVDGASESGSGSVALNNPALAESQARKELFRAKLVELEYEERVRTLVLKSVVEAEAFRMARQVRDAVMNVSSRKSGDLAAETDQRKVKEMLDAELRIALQGLSAPELTM